MQWQQLLLFLRREGGGRVQHKIIMSAVTCASYRLLGLQSSDLK